MEGNEKDSKIKELTDKVEFLSSIIIKAHKYAKDDPEVALTQARKSAEAICRNIFSAEIGEPGKIMLDELIKKLAERKVLPTKILIPLGTIQAYGNYGTHAQSATENIDFNYITPCLSALAQVSSWYFTEYLKTNIPADLAAEENREAKQAKDSTVPQGAVPKPLQKAPSTAGSTASAAGGSKSKSMLWIGIGAVAVVVVVVIIILSGRKPEQTEANAVPDSTKAAMNTASLQASKDSTVMPAQKPAETTVAKEEQSKEKEPATKGTTPGGQQPHAGGTQTANVGKEKPVVSTQQPQAPATADVDPTVVKEYPPVYPASMQGSHVNGEVRVRVYVDANGNPTDARILSYDDERFQQPAIDAAMHYKFNPGLAAGKPVPAWATVKIQFTSK